MKTIVAQEKERCRLMSANFTAMTSSCRPDFDGSMCWESKAAGDIVQMECPFEFCSTCTVEDVKVWHTLQEGSRLILPAGAQETASVTLRVHKYRAVFCAPSGAAIDHCPSRRPEHMSPRFLRLFVIESEATVWSSCLVISRP
ncbi:Parathyroid hormone 2 receptor [Trichuris trichiura]|uniref:Parathyroid hormone 2 receptor n=1 Tax=Trichuris trichiura TaxID=36087 RepID=A0A077YZW4_TRITR|nr:Parathyroid hormone 2 receptor [Trichuris trichiura]